MSDWRSRSMPSTDRARGNPRPLTLLIAACLALLLLSDAMTGRVGLISAFSPSSSSMHALLENMAFQATIQAGEAHTTQLAPIVTTPSLAETIDPRTAASAAGLSDACEPSGDPRYCLYTVSEGDTLGAIAERFGLEGATLPGWQLIFESNKLELAGGEDLLVPGWVLRLPRTDAVLHLVLPGDSVGGLAVAYDVTSEAITDANGLPDPNQVQIGDLLLIPSPNQVPPIVLPEPAPSVEDEEPADDAAPKDDTPEPAEETPEASAVTETSPETEDADGAAEDESTDQTAESGGGSPEAGSPDAAGTPNGGDSESSETGGGADGSNQTGNATEAGQRAAAAVTDDPTSMSWPVLLPLAITNYMSARHPLGMDFGLGQAVGSPIMAAAGGTVEFAGGDPCCSYGYYVIVDHGNGLKSLYAHLSSIAVSKGQAVGRGQALGIAGNTGNSRGVHLHFEVYRNGTRVDPMTYLSR